MNNFISWIIFVSTVTAGFSQSLIKTVVHKTNAAAEKINDLWCYQCEYVNDGEECLNPLTDNRSSLIKKCKPDEFVCMVKRFSFTTSTENSTTNPKMWALERKCTNSCEPGCIVIGERTKLYACISCCETTFCNTGKGKANIIQQNIFLKVLPIVFILPLFVHKLALCFSE